MNRKSAIVLGGCGFIGINCVLRLLQEGYTVTSVDNLSRGTARANLRWIMNRGNSFDGGFAFVNADIRHFDDLRTAFASHVKEYGVPEVIFHQAAQVAVTQSLIQTRNDFETNALGTFNVLEATRSLCPEATLIFSSTNKVYGSLKTIPTRELYGRYEFENLPNGVPVTQPLDFYSPYGCSKGAADQYVRDYSRIFNLRTMVFRQSCIYGTRQFGQEDQGWVSWFVIAALLKKKITVYGNGKQVRDILWIDDLIEAYWKAWQGPNPGGEIFNMGGGPRNTLSLLELLDILRDLDPDLDEPDFGDWRPGDQPIYVSDIRDTCERTAWEPKCTPEEGVKKLWCWARQNLAEIQAVVDSGFPRPAVKHEEHVLVGD